jgi:putative modified peptide
MSQKNVERIIGRLATDEEFRRLFQADPGKAVRELNEQGVELTRSEVAALAATDASVFDRVAEALDPRLQKASLRSGSFPSPFDRRTS